MKLIYKPYDLLLKKPFAIAHGVRTQTEAVFVELHHENLIGYGEAAFPPYLIENRTSAIQFFLQPKMQRSSLKILSEKTLSFLHTV